MDHETNPFSISKASDLTDGDIQSYWVDSMNFESFIEPKVLKPKFIVGGKGSGKTHLMRYFSYEVQLESKKTITKIVEENGYIGVFFRASTIFGSKFLHTTDNEKWIRIFYYYFELFVTNKHIFPILEQFVKEYPEKEEELVNKILALFDVTFCEKNTLLEVGRSISKEIKSLNLIINNYLFDKKIIDSIQIKLSKSELLFGIPLIIKKVFVDIPNIENLVFNYFIDEFENFEKEHQQYVQTLVRESGDTCTFRLGIRTHAYESSILKTEHSTEINKVGSELSCLFLDKWLMNEKNKYEEYILKIIKKKFNPKGISKYKEYKTYLASLFLKEDKALNSDKAFNKLKKELVRLKIDSLEKTQIINNLKVNSPIPVNKYLLEKINIYKFYKQSNKSPTLLEVSIAINEDCKKFINGDSDIYKNDLEKQKENMYAQLCEENNVKNSVYLGLSNFINISFYNPRHFINLMNNLYDYAKYYDVKLIDGVPEKIQIQSVQKLLNWFEDDYDKQGKYGYQLQIYMDRICRYFEAIRFIPKPLDTSTTSFFVKDENYINYKEQIMALKGRLILIEKDKKRLGKNAKQYIQNQSFSINYIYSEKYKLPVIDRGSREFKDEDLKAIFSESDVLFNKIILNIQQNGSKLKTKKSLNNQRTLKW